MASRITWLAQTLIGHAANLDHHTDDIALLLLEAAADPEYA
ncbi:hypothetical protein [Nonomuraea sp. NPDC046570]